MSTLKVEILNIDQISEHPNAERLELAIVKGWQVVVRKGEFKPGDLCIYFPIDSLLPGKVEEKIFGPDSKVKLNKGRVKTIKLRGAISQGLVVPCALLECEKYPVGKDLTDLLEVKKYEPGPPAFEGFNGGSRPKREVNPNFHKYTSIENFKNYHTVFKPDDEVVITEKIHGTNFRAGWVPTFPKNWFQKILLFFRMLPRWEFVVGSHNLERKYKDDNVYSNTARKLGLKEKLDKGEVIYGEIYGPTIQRGYHYGLNKDELGFVCFDIKKNGQYQKFDLVELFCSVWKIQTVPVLFRGKFGNVDVRQISQGDSVLAPTQKCREGIVIKPVAEEVCHMGRKVLKFINDEYLLGDQSEFH